VNAATANPKIDIANGDEPREFLGQSVGFKNELIGQSNFPHQPRHAKSLSRVANFPEPAGFPDALEIPSRTGRLRAGICRQRPGLGKAESWLWAAAGTDADAPLVALREGLLTALRVPSGKQPLTVFSRNFMFS
jgi:hypothetical protein